MTFPRAAPWLFAIEIVTRMGGDNFGRVAKIGSVQGIELGPQASPGDVQRCSKKGR